MRFRQIVKPCLASLRWRPSEARSGPPYAVETGRGRGGSMDLGGLCLCYCYASLGDWWENSGSCHLSLKFQRNVTLPGTRRHDAVQFHTDML